MTTKNLLIRITYDNSVPQQDNLVESEVTEFATQLRMSLINQVKGLQVTAHSFSPEDPQEVDIPDHEFEQLLDPGVDSQGSIYSHFPCHQCPMTFQSDRGLKIHIGRAHKAL